MNTRLRLLVSAFLVLSVIATMEAEARRPQHGIAKIDIGEVKALVRSEIRRDEKIISKRMNISRLRKTRAKLKADFEEKKRVIKKLRNAGGPILMEVVSILSKTLGDEKRVVSTVSTESRQRRNAFQTLKNNLVLKNKALDLLANVKRRR